MSSSVEEEARTSTGDDLPELDYGDTLSEDAGDEEEIKKRLKGLGYIS